MDKDKIIKDVLIQKRNELMKKLFEEGFSYSDIAFIFKVAHTTVLRMLKNYD